MYFIAPLAVLHYAWSKKGDLFSLSGDIIRPLIYGLVLAIFLTFRIPAIRKAFASFRPRSLILPPKQETQPKVDTP